MQKWALVLSGGRDSGVHRAPPAQRRRPPAGNNVPREQWEPPLITNCSVIFLPLPGRQQAEHLKQQWDAAGSFKAVDGSPSGSTHPCSTPHPPFPLQLQFSLTLFRPFLPLSFPLSFPPTNAALTRGVVPAPLSPSHAEPRPCSPLTFTR